MKHRKYRCEIKHALSGINQIIENFLPVIPGAQLGGGGPGGPDPCLFFKRAKVPFSGERLCEMEALLICK